MGQRSEVATGSHRALGWDHGEYVGIEKPHERLDGLEPGARATAGEDVDAQRHEGPGLGLAEGLADARGVRAHEVLLQLAELLVRDDDVGEVSKARRDAVDDAGFSDGAVHHLTRAGDAVAGLRLEGDGLALPRDGLEPGEIERVPVERDHERTIAPGAHLTLRPRGGSLDPARMAPPEETSMQRCALAFLLCALAGQASADEWVSLFDGRSLAGWKAAENPASFSVQGGAIACDGPRAHLYYVGADGGASFGNFEAEVEVMT